MKVTKTRLKQIIQEELKDCMIDEGLWDKLTGQSKKEAHHLLYAIKNPWYPGQPWAGCQGAQQGDCRPPNKETAQEVIKKYEKLEQQVKEMDHNDAIPSKLLSQIKQELRDMRYKLLDWEKEFGLGEADPRFATVGTGWQKSKGAQDRADRQYRIKHGKARQMSSAFTGQNLGEALRLTRAQLNQLVQEELEAVMLEKGEDDKWIQGAEKDIEKRGTEGVCTGDKFGGPTCKPGTKRYNLAKTFRKMAKDRKK